MILVGFRELQLNVNRSMSGLNRSVKDAAVCLRVCVSINVFERDRDLDRLSMMNKNDS